MGSKKNNKTSRDSFIYILDTIPNPIFEVDDKLIITLANQEAHKKWPIIVEGKSFSYDVLSSIKKKPRYSIVEKTFSQKKSQSSIIKTQKGEYLEVKTNFIKKDDSKRVVVHIRDITEQKKAADALSQSESRYRNLVETLHEGLGIVDPKENIIFANKAYCDILGYSQEEIIGINLKELVPEKEYRKILSETQKRKKGVSSAYEIKIRHKSGEMKDILQSVTPLFDENNRYKGALGVLLDISDRKKVEKAFRDSEEKYRTLTENINVGIYRILLGPRGKYLEVNPALVKMFGYKNRNEFLKIYPIDLYQIKKDRARFSKKLKENGFVRNEELQLKKKDGTPIICSTTAIVVKDLKGKELYIDGMVENITLRKQTEQALRDAHDQLEKRVEERTLELRKANIELKQEIDVRLKAEEALRTSEANYRGLFENMLEGVYQTRPDGTFISANPALIRLLGFSSEKEFLAVANARDLHIRSGERDFSINKLEKEGIVRNVELELRCKDGKEITVLENARIVRNEKGKVSHYEGVLTDITERRQEAKIQNVLFNISQATNSTDNLEELLKTIHQELSTLIDTTNFYVALYDEKSDLYSFPYTVDEFEEGESFSPQQLKKSLTDYVRKTGKPFLADEKTHRELIKKGEVELVGEPSLIWMGVPLITPPGTIGVVVLQSYKDRELYSKKDLKLMSFISEHIAMAINRKHAEEQIIASLKEKEVLLKEIHHRVKNNMQIISSLLKLQETKIKDQSVIRAFQESQNRIRSMAMIHEKLYKSEDLAKIDIGKYIESLATDIFWTYNVSPDTITLKIKVKNVYLDINFAIPCGLIINELVSNSLKYAFPEGKKGEIVIDFRYNNQKYNLTVSDNGVGFPKKLDFMNVKSLGLQLVSLLSKRIGGTIKLNRKKGATIQISFKGDED